MRGLSILGLSILVFAACKKENTANNDKNSKLMNGTYTGSDLDVISISEAKALAEKLRLEYIERGITVAGGLSNTPRSISDSFELTGFNGIPAAYVFNYTDGGYTLIAADYRCHPVLALVPQGELNLNDSLVAPIVDWLGQNIEYIDMIRDGKIADTSSYPAMRAAWSGFVGDLMVDGSKFIHPERFIGTYNPCDNWSYLSYGPLLATNWGQKDTYNDMLTPAGNCAPNLKPPTGCVATAMAQIIRYWQPTTQFNYLYNTMPNNLGNTEVQRLMKDIGISVNMDYTLCDESKAASENVKNALETTFNFSSGGTYNNFHSGGVFDDVKNAKPVYVRADDITYTNGLFFGLFKKKNTSGHAWVIDGVRREIVGCQMSYMFHMNWGLFEVGMQTSINLNGWYWENNWVVNISNSLFNYQYNKKYYKNIHL